MQLLWASQFTQIPSHTAPPCEALIKYSALLSVSLFGFAVGGLSRASSAGHLGDMMRFTMSI